jgi:hypothetical protein
VLVTHAKLFPVPCQNIHVSFLRTVPPYTNYSKLVFRLHCLVTHAKMFPVPYQNIHVSFLRTVPPYSHQADVWVELLKHFHYRQIVFIHSSDTDGRSILGKPKRVCYGCHEIFAKQIFVKFRNIFIS